MFSFKQFHIDDTRSAMKVGTDAVMIGAWAEGVTDVNHIIDVGAGSGVIALMTAQRFPTAHITAIELDADAAADCRHNTMLSPWTDRISVRNEDFLTVSPGSLSPAQLIVSNPPFFTETLKSPSRARAGARHEGGLSVETLLSHSIALLSPKGVIAFIAPATRDNEIDFTIARLRLVTLKKLKMRQRPDLPEVRTLRIVGLQSDFPNAGPADVERLTIRGADGNYSDNYRQLTCDFYLDKMFL